jgi:hypothetical protein
VKASPTSGGAICVLGQGGPDVRIERRILGGGVLKPAVDHVTGVFVGCLVGHNFRKIGGQEEPEAGMDLAAHDRGEVTGLSR